MRILLAAGLAALLAVAVPGAVRADDDWDDYRERIERQRRRAWNAHKERLEDWREQREEYYEDLRERREDYYDDLRRQQRRYSRDPYRYRGYVPQPYFRGYRYPPPPSYRFHPAPSHRRPGGFWIQAPRGGFSITW